MKYQLYPQRKWYKNTNIEFAALGLFVAGLVFSGPLLLTYAILWGVALGERLWG